MFQRNSCGRLRPGVIVVVRLLKAAGRCWLCCPDSQLHRQGIWYLCLHAVQTTLWLHETTLFLHTLTTRIQ